MAPLPPASAASVLSAADLDQPPQRPGPVSQSHHVDRITGGQPEPVHGQPVRVVRAEVVPEQLPQVADHLGAFLCR